MNPIKMLRRARSLTQQEMARRVGTSQSAIAAYEKGSKSPTLRTVEHFARSLSLNIETRVTELLTREERRSLVYHRAVAAKLLNEPQAMIVRARNHLQRLLELHPHAAPLLSIWKALLKLPPPLLSACMTDTSEIARDLRQVSPFAGALTPRERVEALKAFREELVA